MIRLKVGILKNTTYIKCARSNNIRLRFYITQLGDVSSKTSLDEHDLDIIAYLDEHEDNASLFDLPPADNEGDIYALMAEGVLNNIPTGADLGIYNYQPIDEDYSQYIGTQYIKSIDDIDKDQTPFEYYDEEDYNFANCILAEDETIVSNDTNIVSTFKGYLEVTTKEFSIIRRCDGRGIYKVYIPQSYIHKYQLRNGDELVVTYTESNGKMILASLFNINQQPYYKWNIKRKWFDNLKPLTLSTLIDATGQYTKQIASKFDIFEGDKIFVYLKDTPKPTLLINFINELNDMFDKIVYINPHYNMPNVLDKYHNMVKFCASPMQDNETQGKVCLLGANYARRMVELGYRVAIIIDDIDAIANLDAKYLPETPIYKTIFGASKVTSVGSATMFALASLGLESSNTLPKNDMATLNILIENNEIDLFNSYRA